MDRWIRRIWIAGLLLTASLTAGCGKEDSTEEIHSFAIWEQDETEVTALSDGTAVERWKNEDEAACQYRYRLSDGTELLQTTDVTTPEDGSGSDLNGLDMMQASVAAAVQSYYASQGLLYDLEQQLEDAYADYLACAENGEKFTLHEVSQDITETAETERYLLFLTAVTAPKKQHFDGGTTCRYSIAVFDRETGEEMDFWDLFRKSESEVRAELAAACAKQDNTVDDSAVSSVIDQAQILLFQDYLEVWFPYGTWERQEFDKGFGFEYDNVPDLLYDWAVPREAEDE